MEIKDSGNRTEFESGAVRDMKGEEKGRMDLMPLEVVAKVMMDDMVVKNIAQFMRDGDTKLLYCAIENIRDNAFGEDEIKMLLEVGIHFQQGAMKYGENNWKKGIPAWSYIDSALRHYMKWWRGDNDEPHARAAVWNLMCCIWELDYSDRAKG